MAFGLSLLVVMALLAYSVFLGGAGHGIYGPIWISLSGLALVPWAFLTTARREAPDRLVLVLTIADVVTLGVLAAEISFSYAGRMYFQDWSGLARVGGWFALWIAWQVPTFRYWFAYQRRGGET